MAGSQGCPCGAIIHSLFAVSEEHLFKISVRWCCCSNLVLCRQKPWLCLTHLHPAYRSDPPKSRDLRAKHYKLFPHVVWWTNQQPLHWVKLRNTSLKLLSLIKPRICTYSHMQWLCFSTWIFNDAALLEWCCLQLTLCPWSAILLQAKGFMSTR